MRAFAHLTWSIFALVIFTARFIADRLDTVPTMPRNIGVTRLLYGGWYLHVVP